MSKMRMAVLFGGVSSEHEVSLMSVQLVLEHADPEKYELYPIGITKDGRWRLVTGSYDAIQSDLWQDDMHSVPAILSPDASVHGLEIFGQEHRRVRIDVAFPVLHGRGGEDGTLQGLLELSGIPYVGCGVMASANCMDKGTAKILFAAAGIPQCPYTVCDMGDYRAAPEAVLDRIETALCYPIFVKPANAGSSVGISKAPDRAALAGAIELAGQHDRKIVLEACVDAREIEVAVMGNNSPVASQPGEILPSNDFYDYRAKYIDGKSGLAIPADIPADLCARIRELAVRAYRACGCQGLSRVDFFLDRRTGELYLNEINTLPGFTEISMYPKLFQHAGLSCREIVDRLVDLALKRRALAD